MFPTFIRLGSVHSVVLETRLRDALNWGAKIYTSRDIKRNGISSVVESLPENGKFFISFDVDGLDRFNIAGTHLHQGDSIGGI